MSTASTYSTIVPDLFTQLNVLLKGYVYNEYTALAQALKAPTIGAFTVYIALYGLSLSLGWIEGNFNQFVKMIFKMSCILTFAFHWGMFSQYVVTGIQSSADFIASTLLKTVVLPGFDFSSGHLNHAIQLLVTEITQVGGWIWQHGNFHDISPYFIAIIYWGFGFFSILIGLVEITVAYLGLAILFTMAPLFIVFTLFSTTYGFFDRWMGTIAGFALSLIFISSSLALVLSLLQWIVVDCYVSRAANIRLVSWVGILFVGFISTAVLRHMADAAKSIGNSIYTLSSNNMFAGRLGGYLFLTSQVSSSARKKLRQGASHES